jgi:putative Flp pilus-assembly TadE/G-like protein
MWGRGDSERGSVLPLVAVGILVAGGAVLLLGRMGSAAVDRASARTAADAAALAGAAEGRAAASSVAAANGARLASYREQGSDTEVSVTVGQARAVARARRQGGGGALPPGAMAPALRAVWTRAGQLLGQAVAVREVVASSTGQPGMAVSVFPADVARLSTVAAGAGLCRPRPDADPTRFEVCR